MLEARGDDVKELCCRRRIRQCRQNETARVQVTAPRGGDQALDVPTQLLRSSLGGGDPLVADERAHEVTEQGPPLVGGAMELAPKKPMSHGRLSYAGDAGDAGAKMASRLAAER